MLSTLGAIILTIDAMTSIANIDHTSTALPARVYQPHTPVLEAVIDHYNNKGSWAGTFMIESVIAHKIEKISDEKSVAHVKYFYEPVPNNSKGRTDSGIDQRTFTYTQNGNEIKIIEMGAFNSTKL